MHITPPLFSSLGKEGTANRIKSNQCMSGTLHKPYVCVAGIISPNHLLISISLIFIFNRNNPHHLLQCTWAFSMQTTFGPLQDEEEWSCITQIIRHTGNVFVEAKQGGCIALGSQLCWARCEPAFLQAHYLYQFALTIGTVVSSEIRRWISQEYNMLYPQLVCKHIH